MKKAIYAFCVVAIFSFLYSCSDSDSTPIDKVIIEQSKIEVGHNGGVLNIKVESYEDFIVENNLDWCDVTVDDIKSEISGGFKRYNLQVVVDKNYSEVERNGIFKIISSNNEFPIQIIQKEGPDELISITNKPDILDYLGETVDISIVSYSDYSVESKVQWCTVEIENVESGTDSKTDILKVKVERNNTTAERVGVLNITALNKVYPIEIRQAAGKLYLPKLGPYQYENINDNLGKLSFDVVYNSPTRINPKFASEIFIHQLINKEDYFTKDKIQKIDYDYPITSIFSEVGANFFSFTDVKPSSELQKYMFDKILTELDRVNQSGHMFYSNSETYFSRKGLHFAGLVAFGLNLDELMGASYKNEELQSKIGLVFEYSQTFFTLTGDYPSSKIKLPNGVITKDIAFSDGITYGRYGYLLVEVDESKRQEMKALIQKVSRNEKLTNEEEQLFANSNYGYIRPDADRYIFARGSHSVDLFFADMQKPIKEFCLPIQTGLSEAEHMGVMSNFKVSISE